MSTSRKPVSAATDYERLTQFVYQSLLKAEGVDGVRVEHNVHILGKSGHSYQIDVYWEYHLAGLAHHVAVSCKNYRRKVAVGDVSDFNSVLQDVGDIKGVMVTPRGYQRGALKVAKQFGIRLLHLRAPTDEDWAGRVQTIHLNIGFCQVRVTRRKLDFDVEWCKARGMVGKKGQIAGLTTDIALLDAAGEKLTDLYEIERKLPFEWEPAEGLTHEDKFDDAYLDIPGAGLAKLKSIEFTYDITRDEQRLVVGGNELVRTMLGDAQGDWKVFIDEGGKVTGDVERRAGPKAEDRPST